MAWQQFEKDCFHYLKRNFPYVLKIEDFGKADSTKADIKITTICHGAYYVEIKEADSQCGQFVLFPQEDTRTFLFSSGNKSVITPNCAAIIAAMEKEYDKFAAVGTAGIPIPVSKEVLYGWVQDFYRAKDVKYFITKGETYIVFPLEKFQDYFDIAAFYRRKTSGSSEPNEKRNREEILQGLARDHIPGYLTFQTVEGKRRCFLHTSLSVDKRRIQCDKYTYQFKKNEYAQMISAGGELVYEVRRLSNTSNPNVICQLTLKTFRQDPDDLRRFEEDL